MDFRAVLETLAAFFERRAEPFAVIGGVALATYGLARTTFDLDLVVHRRVQDDLVRFLEGQGYQTLHRSPGYSSHLHADSARGAVDVVFVGSDTGDQIFSEAARVVGPGGLEVVVPCPEHLIAMKVVAMKNDPTRRFHDMADIAFLLRGETVDRGAVRGTFVRHGMLESYREIERALEA